VQRFGDIEVTVGDDHVALVEMRRPPNNFFDVGLIKNIADAYQELDADGRCRVVVLCSEGKHFCAGADFAGGATPPTGGPDALYGEAVRLMQSAKPVVAAVQGGAIGGGLGLACSADFRVAASTSRFTSNFAQLGFHHGFGLTLTLPRIVGNQVALELMYTGRRIDGARAHEIGLADRLVEPGREREAAQELAREIASSAPLAVQSIRRTMRGPLAEEFRAATTHEGTEQIWLRTTEDFGEGVAASRDRRAPRFVGR